MSDYAAGIFVFGGLIFGISKLRSLSGNFHTRPKMFSALWNSRALQRYLLATERLLEKNGRSRKEAQQFLVTQILLGFSLFLMGLVAFHRGFPIYISLILGTIGFLLPRMKLQSSVRKRQKQIIFALPYYLDMVTLALEAGLDLIAAIEELVRQDSDHPLKEELLISLKSIRMGETRSHAFQALGERTGVEPLRSLAACISQSEELGASLGHLFRLQADSLRQEIFRTAEEQAQKAPVKMLFPLIFCIFPVIFILLFVPIALLLTSAH